jgi:hypothetical protein
MKFSLIIVFLLTLVACTSKSKEHEQTKEDKQNQTESSGPKPDQETKETSPKTEGTDQTTESYPDDKSGLLDSAAENSSRTKDKAKSPKTQVPR